jgi:hypothetical protein
MVDQQSDLQRPHNSAPVLGNKKNDVLFTAGLGFTFGAKAK